MAHWKNIVMNMIYTCTVFLNKDDDDDNDDDDDDVDVDVDVDNRDFKHRQRGRQPRRENVRENPNYLLRMYGGKYLDVLRRGPT